MDGRFVRMTSAPARGGEISPGTALAPHRRDAGAGGGRPRAAPPMSHWQVHGGLADVPGPGGQLEKARPAWRVSVVSGLYGFICGGAMRAPGVMMTSPVDLRQISYTRSD